MGDQFSDFTTMQIAFPMSASSASGTRSSPANDHYEFPAFPCFTNCAVVRVAQVRQPPHLREARGMDGLLLGALRNFSPPLTADLLPFRPVGP